MVNLLGMNRFGNRSLVSVLLIVAAISLGTSGYMVVESWGLRDSLYMTVITLSTIGYGEIHPLSNHGRDFTILLILLGVGTVAYVVNSGMRGLFEGDWQKAMGRRKLETKLKSMDNHIIVCGYGRMGKVVCNELRSKKIPFVIIEQTEIDRSPDDGAPFIKGDATQDEVLSSAGVMRARGLISALSTDAQNLYLVLSAKGMNPNIKVVARASDESAEQKLKRAGADQVVSPYHYGGIWMANMIIKPAVVNFLEFATRIGNIEFQIEEVVVQPGARLDGASIGKSAISAELGILVAAVKKADNTMKFNPPLDTVIQGEDTLVVIGDSAKLAQLEILAKKQQP